MGQNFIRSVFYYKHYFLDFFAELTEDVQRKFELMATTERIPVKYFKHMEGTTGLYEIRVEAGSNIFRAFAFFDQGQLIVVANGFQKNRKRHLKTK